MVRCSSVSPLTSIIENCHNREILERVFTQMQSFLSDPILKDDYMLQIELLKSFRRISTRVNAKFREESIRQNLISIQLMHENIRDCIFKSDPSIFNNRNNPDKERHNRKRLRVHNVRNHIRLSID